MRFYENKYVFNINKTTRQLVISTLKPHVNRR